MSTVQKHLEEIRIEPRHDVKNKLLNFNYM